MNGMPVLLLFVVTTFHLADALSNVFAFVETNADMYLAHQLAGDVHANSSPTHYLWGICKETVATNQKGLLTL